MNKSQFLDDTALAHLFAKEPNQYIQTRRNIPTQWGRNKVADPIQPGIPKKGSYVSESMLFCQVLWIELWLHTFISSVNYKEELLLSYTGIEVSI